LIKSSSVITSYNDSEVFQKNLKHAEKSYTSKTDYCVVIVNIDVDADTMTVKVNSQTVAQRKGYWGSYGGGWSVTFFCMKGVSFEASWDGANGSNEGNRSISFTEYSL